MRHPNQKSPIEYAPRHVREKPEKPAPGAKERDLKALAEMQAARPKAPPRAREGLK